MNTARMPGLTTPVYSWMNWKAWSMPPSRGAITQAIARATAAEMRPIRTVARSSASGWMCALKMSIVKMVEVLLSIDASEDTMAAASAAKAKPLRPVGRNCSSHG